MLLSSHLPVLYYICTCTCCFPFSLSLLVPQIQAHHAGSSPPSPPHRYGVQLWMQQRGGCWTAGHYPLTGCPRFLFCSHYSFIWSFFPKHTISRPFFDWAHSDCCFMHYSVVGSICGLSPLVQKRSSNASSQRPAHSEPVHTDHEYRLLSPFQKTNVQTLCEDTGIKNIAPQTTQMDGMFMPLPPPPA